MKNRTIFLIAAVLCFAISCSKETEPKEFPIEIDYEFPYYALLNLSKHTLAIAGKFEYEQEDFPDSLILQHGEQFKFEELNFFEINAKRTIYYDARYAISADDLPHERNPRINGSSSYVEVWKGKWHVCDLFTFTEEDYLYAVEHGTDLKAGE